MVLPGEVALTQYLRPGGRVKRVLADIDIKHAEKALPLVLSCECLPDGRVVIYGRRHWQTKEEEITEIADNGPGDNTPNDALIRIIDRLTETTPKEST